MTSEAEIRDFLFLLLSSSVLPVTVDGKIYKTKRPANSRNEDVTISVLDSGNGQFQTAIVNVNLYVRDVQYEANAFAEDTKRVRELSELMIEILDGYVDEEYNLRMDSQHVMEVEGEKQHCINNRVLFTVNNVRETLYKSFKGV